MVSFYDHCSGSTGTAEKRARAGGAPVHTEREILGRTRVSEITDLLRSRIQGGELAPGDRLPAERELAGDLGVARPTLRQALKILQEEGYVRCLRGASGGTFVAELEQPLTQRFEQLRANADEFDDILQLRQAVETQAARLAAERREKDDLQAMEESVTSLLAADSRALFRQADSVFHTAVARASRSPRLETAIRKARGELFLPIDALYFPEQMAVSSRDHLAILEAIRRREPERAAHEMAVHIDNARRELYDIILRTETTV
jgi:GntR family transcriptional regulator, transcriptional repressor for pyruvate dehydrogenase complex